MSDLSNVKTTLVKHSGELLELLQGLGIGTRQLENAEPTYKAVVEHNKLCVKRWRQRNPERYRSYQRKYYGTEKGKARLRAVYRSEAYKKRKKAYRQRPEVKAKIQAYQAAYRAANLERIRERDRAYAVANREHRKAYQAEYNERNKELLRAKARAYYAKKKAQQAKRATAND